MFPVSELEGASSLVSSSVVPLARESQDRGNGSSPGLGKLVGVLQLLVTLRSAALNECLLASNLRRIALIRQVCEFGFVDLTATLGYSLAARGLAICSR